MLSAWRKCFTDWWRLGWRCHGKSLGCCFVAVQLWHCEQDWFLQPRCRCSFTHQVATEVKRSGPTSSCLGYVSVCHLGWLSDWFCHFWWCCASWPMGFISFRFIGWLARKGSGSRIGSDYSVSCKWNTLTLRSWTQVGHMGQERTMALLCLRCFWPGMATDVKGHIGDCARCVRHKHPVNQVAPLQNVFTTHPMELVCMDYLTLEMSKGGFKNSLVVTDHFTKYSQAYPTRNQTAKMIVQVLYNNFIMHYGFPALLHSDQGRNFESKVLSGKEKSGTTPYTPWGMTSARGSTALFRRCLVLWRLTRRLTGSHMLPLWCICTTVPSTTPLVFLRTTCCLAESPDCQSICFFPVLTPLRLTPLVATLKGSGDGWGMLIRWCKLCWKEKGRPARRGMAKKVVRGATLQPGDQVLLHQVGLQAKNKLAERWQEEVYVVTSQPNTSIHVFSVRCVDGKGMVKSVHRNLLWPVRSVPDLVPSKPKSVPRQTPILTRSHTRLRNRNDRAPRSDSNPESVQSHDTVSTVVPQPQTCVITQKQSRVLTKMGTRPVSN